MRPRASPVDSIFCEPRGARQKIVGTPPLLQARASTLETGCLSILQPILGRHAGSVRKSSDILRAEIRKNDAAAADYECGLRNDDKTRTKPQGCARAHSQRIDLVARRRNVRDATDFHTIRGKDLRADELLMS